MLVAVAAHRIVAAGVADVDDEPLGLVAQAVEGRPRHRRRDLDAGLAGYLCRTDRGAELRRIAATRYAEPRTGKPPPIWDNVEKDVTGRTLLRSGNCFQVLDDPNVGNRYAFETFEQYLVQCSFGFGRKRGKNLPWVETIRSRYNHLRDPDGSYWTGYVFADDARWPVERSTWTAAAVLLAVDALEAGIDTGTVYLDQVTLAASLDAEALWEVPRTSVLLEGLYNNGDSLSGELTGDLQIVSNLESGPNELRLYQAYGALQGSYGQLVATLGLDALPAGWTWHTDRAGFRVPAPVDWEYFRGNDINGRMINLADYRGRPVVLSPNQVAHAESWRMSR